MSCVEASQLLRRVSPVGPVKRRIGDAAQRFGWSYTRTFSVWYQRARRIDAEEMDALRREANQLASRYAAVAAAMGIADADFYQSDIDALVNAARALRGMDSA